MESGERTPEPPRRAEEEPAAAPAVGPSRGRATPPPPSERRRRLARLARGVGVAALLLGVAVLGARRFGEPGSALGRLVGLGSSCGNGSIEIGEECDDGNAQAEDGCLPTCRLATCGDGVVRAHVEDCDDGNRDDGDGCSSACLACPPSPSRFAWSANGHCYWRHEAASPWDEATSACARDGGHLVSYADDREWQAVTERLFATGSAPAWIGLREEDRNGLRNFGWVTGERVLAAHWGIQEPRRVPAGLDCGVQLAAGAWAAEGCGEARAFVCERPGWVSPPGSPHAYRGFTRRVRWTEARDACAAAGGHLVTLEDAEEQGFVARRFYGGGWLGATLDEATGRFGWITGARFRYDDFAPGEPNLLRAEKCVVLDVDGRWYNRDCGNRHRFVCEVE